jgi:MtN3 and saliva related transmembrane protein
MFVRVFLFFSLFLPFARLSAWHSICSTARLRMDVFNLPLTDFVGWLSSGILVLTVSRQVYTQWKRGSSEGVSQWLFLGQMAASVGFSIYSWLVQNWVFIVTNVLLLAAAIVGYSILLHHRRLERR